MANYFKHFPLLTYNKEVIRDITKRVKFLDDLNNDPLSFMPYTVKDGESAQDISYYYYGSPIYVWIIYVANGIIDPLIEWPLSTRDLERTIVKKYKTRAETSEGTSLKYQGVLDWTKNATINDNIVYYYNNEGRKISVDTYLYGGVEVADWSARRIYDEEIIKNEEKRDIQLLNKEYLDVAMDNLKEILGT